MPTEPNVSDAWLLIALHWKGDPAAVIAQADHLNAAVPSYQEWVHACEVLGERGLIEAADPLPLPSPFAESIVRRLNGARAFGRGLPRKILGEIATLPVVGRPVSPPAPKVLADATAEVERRYQAYNEESARRSRLAKLRDAWLLAALHLKNLPTFAETEPDPEPLTFFHWLHACEILGERGLIEPDGAFLRATPNGAALVDACLGHKRPTPDLPRCLLYRIESLPDRQSPVALPSRDAIRRAEREHGWV